MKRYIVCVNICCNARESKKHEKKEYEDWLTSLLLHSWLCLTKKQIIEVKTRFNVDVEISPKTLVTSIPIESFEVMNVYPSITKEIAFHSYTTPIPIQAQVLFVALFGHDVLGCTKTRSMKIVAFVLLFIQHSLAQPLMWWGDRPLALVLVPTK
jgi:ATP-dependent RNA helicase DDX5/DBP2